jgi:hypothetical protein
MSTLSKLKLISSKRQRTVSPIVHRRNKLSTKIFEQIELVTARSNGTIYAPSKLKTFINKETGERRTVETTKRVKEWFWTSDNGKLNLSIRYGSKVLELAKGKNAIEIANNEELISTLGLIKDAVISGELDDAITNASEKLRTGFAK